MSEISAVTSSIPVLTGSISIVSPSAQSSSSASQAASHPAAQRPLAHRLHDVLVGTRHSTLTAWRNAICVVFALAGISTAVWVARIPEVSARLGIGSGGVALLLVGLSSGSILGLAVAPALIARLGARRMLTAGITGVGIGLTSIGVAVDLLASSGLTFAALMIFGFSLSSSSVTMNLEGTTVEKRVGRTILPMMHACYSAGTITGALLGAFAASSGMALLPYLAFASVFLLVAGLGTVRSVPSTDTPQRIHFGAINERAAAAVADDPQPGTAATAATKTGLRSKLGLLADRRLLLIGVMMIGMSFVEGSANDWLSLAAVDGHGLDHSGAALIYATFVAAMTVGRLVGGPLVDRLGTTRVLLCCATVASIGLGVFIFAAGTPLIFAATALWGLGASLGFPVGMSLAADHPTDATKRVSMVSIFGYSASLAGPPALGVLAEHFGILHAFVLVLGFVVVSLAVLPGTRKR